MSFQRARQPDQIEQRRAALIEAAGDLFEHQGFDATTLSAIGKKAGVSKASVYRYFESKEAIFMHILLTELEAWTASLEQSLRPAPSPRTPDDVADVLTRSVLERHRLSALSALLTAVLEKNISLDGLRAFKRSYMGFVLRAVNALHAALPALDVGSAQLLLTYFVFFQNGLQPTAPPAPVVAQLLEEPEFASLHIDAEATLFAYTRTVLRGLLSSRGDSP